MSVRPLNPEEFLQGVNTFAEEIAALEQKVLAAAHAAQERGERSFHISLGETSNKVWMPVKEAWMKAASATKRWEITYDYSHNGSTLSLKVVPIQ